MTRLSPTAERALAALKPCACRECQHARAVLDMGARRAGPVDADVTTALRPCPARGGER